MIPMNRDPQETLTAYLLSANRNGEAEPCLVQQDQHRDGQK